MIISLLSYSPGDIEVLGKDGDGNVNDLLFLFPVPVVDLEEVVASWQFGSVQAVVGVIQTISDKAGDTDLLITFVQVGVEEGVEVASTWLVSSTHGLHSDVDLLGLRIVKSEGDFLHVHSVDAVQYLIVILVVCHVELKEVLQVVVEGHEEHTIISIDVAGILLELRSPPGIVVTPWSMVVLFGPWVSNSG